MHGYVESLTILYHALCNGMRLLVYLSWYVPCVIKDLAFLSGYVKS